MALKNKKKHSHFKVYDDRKLLDKLTQAQAREIYYLIDKFTSQKKHGWFPYLRDVKKTLLEKFPEFMKNPMTVEPNWAWTSWRQPGLTGFDSFTLCHSKNHIYTVHFKKIEKNTAYQFAVCAFDVNTRKTQVFKSPEFKQKKLSSSQSYYQHTSKISLDQKRLIFAFQEACYLIDMTENKWQRFDFPKRNYSSLILMGDTLFAGYSPQTDKKFYDSGLVEIDLKTGKEITICGSRVKPAKTILDNRKPSNIFLQKLDDRFIYIRMWPIDAIFDLKTRKIKWIDEFPPEFFQARFNSFLYIKHNLPTYSLKLFRDVNFYPQITTNHKTEELDKILKKTDLPEWQVDFLSLFKYSINTGVGFINLGDRLTTTRESKLFFVKKGSPKLYHIPLILPIPRHLPQQKIEEFSDSYFNNGILKVDNNMRAFSLLYYEGSTLIEKMDQYEKEQKGRQK